MAGVTGRHLAPIAMNGAGDFAIRGRSAGFFVGVRRFREFEELKYAVDDAIDLAHLLSIELGLLEPANVCLALGGEPEKQESADRLGDLLEARGQRIEARHTDVLHHLEPLLRRAGSGGIFCISFATHGFDLLGEQFLVAADSVREHIGGSGIRLNSLLDQVNRQARAERRLILIDACRERLEGARGPGFPEIRDETGQIVLYGAPPGGVAFEDEKLRNGVFTAAVLAGLRGEAPAEHHGYITANGLADYVDQRVVHWIQENHPHLDRPGIGIRRVVDGAAGRIRLAASAYRIRRAEASKKLGLNLGPPLTGAVIDEILTHLPADAPNATALGLLEEIEVLDGSARAKGSLLHYLENEVRPGRENFGPFCRALNLLSGVAGEVDFAEGVRLLSILDLQGDLLARLWIAAARRAGLYGLEVDPEADPSLSEVDLQAVEKRASTSAAGATTLGFAFLHGVVEGRGPQDALSWFRCAADLGEPIAMNWLGLVYERGQEVERNSEAANRWFRRAAELGNAAGAVNLGSSYRLGRGVAEDLDEARRWYERAARAKHPLGLLCLGDLYRDGLGADPNPKEACLLFEEAAGLGDVIAMERLALLYRKGQEVPLHLEGKGVQGVAADEDRALRWARAGAELGSTHAMAVAGEIYADREEYDRAVDWWRRGAELGHPSSMTRLAAAFKQGNGVPRSLEEAVHWYREAAQRGDSEAMGELGFHYWNGDGVEKDLAEAVRWWGAGADAGDLRSVNNLGVAYLYGVGVEQSHAKAYELFSRAADYADMYGQFNLGIMFRDGRGVPRDLQKAVGWFSRAQWAGHPHAEEALQALRDGSAGPRAAEKPSLWGRISESISRYFVNKAAD